MSLLPIVAYELDLGDEHTWRPLRVWVSEALNQPYRAVEGGEHGQQGVVAGGVHDGVDIASLR